ncbi:MAG: hypothetical protein LBT11_05395 [Treponema sp.]|jgi:hypothetical protein|nr:hypothetical protein [Treponema sp.]
MSGCINQRFLRDCRAFCVKRFVDRRREAWYIEGKELDMPAKIQTGLTFEDVWTMFQETDKKFQKTAQEMKLNFQETERIVKENALAIKDLNKQMGGLHNSFGDLAEHLVAPNIAAIHGQTSRQPGYPWGASRCGVSRTGKRSGHRSRVLRDRANRGYDAN